MSELKPRSREEVVAGIIKLALEMWQTFIGSEEGREETLADFDAMIEAAKKPIIRNYFEGLKAAFLESEKEVKR